MSGTFFDDLCLIINSYIVLRIADRGSSETHDSCNGLQINKRKRTSIHEIGNHLFVLNPGFAEGATK